MKASWLWLGLAALAAPVHASAEDAESVKTCVEQNSPQISAVQVLSLTVREGAAQTSESRMKLTWRRLPSGERRVLLRFEAPEDLAGAALLAQLDPGARPVVHLLLPDIGKPQRITSRSQFESFLGEADLGMEELRQLLDPLSGPGLQLVDEAEPLGRPVWVLEERDEDADARYPRVVTHVDQEYCVPLRAEFYAADGSVSKLLRIDPAKVLREGSSWMPRQLVFTDPVGDLEAVLLVEELEVDVPIAPGLLTKRALTMPTPRSFSGADLRQPGSAE